MESEEKEQLENVVIFFSWQSQTKENRNLITRALEKAREILSQNNSNISFSIDEATRDVPGAPNIVETIQNKILNCDIFLCDITPIDDKHEIANSNVMFELGYAVNCIGWNRIILLLNTDIASDSSFVFDIKSHRFESFKTPDSNNKNNEAGQLCNKLVQSIKQVLSSNPPKYLFEHNLQQRIKRNRDIKTITYLFSIAFSFSFWDDYFDNYPLGRWHTDMKIIWDWFADIYNATDFYIYDEFISKKIDDFAKTTEEVFKISWNLFDDGKNGISIALQRDENEQAEFEKSISLMYKSQGLLMEIVRYIKENYVEIDLDKTSQEAYLYFMGKKTSSLKALGLL